MINVEYLTDGNGETKAIVIPIGLWQQIFPGADASLEDISEAVEDYCLNNAMNEAKQSALMSRDEALKFLEQQ